MALNIDFQTLKQHTPFAQHQLVDVTFGEAYADTEIRHTLQPPTPEHILYYVMDQAQSATIYRDMSGSRKPWRDGVITLRSNVANARVKLLLAVAHEKHSLIETSPATVTPAVLAHVHDAADITSGTFVDARIPSLAASKITSGVFDVARIPDLDAAKIVSGTLDVARIPDLSAAKITSGSLDDARLSSNVPLKNAANTFSALNTFSVKPEMTLGLTERGRSEAMGEWTTYTPSWTANSVNPAIGNGTISGRYARVGKTVFFVIFIQAGTTTTFGSGFYLFSTPTTASSLSQNFNVLLYDASANTRYIGTTEFFSSTSFYAVEATTGSDVNPAAPFTFANLDTIRITGFYDEA